MLIKSLSLLFLILFTSPQILLSNEDISSVNQVSSNAFYAKNAKFVRKDVAEKVRQYKEHKRLQDLIRRQKIYTDLLDTLGKQKQGIDEVIRQRKVRILEEKILNINELLNDLKNK